MTTDDVVVTVDPIPTITGTTDVCVGSRTTLSGSGVAASTNAWTSSNAGVATVSSSGLVTGVSAGTATITYTNSGGCQATEVITVNPTPVISGTSETYVGGTTTLSANVSGGTWTSSEPTVFTIDGLGAITGVTSGSGYATYAVTATGCYDTALVTIHALPTISGTLSVCVGSTTDLDGTGTAASSSPWTSSAPSVATVTSAGVVAGLSAGTTTITYTDSYGGSSQQTVTVYALPSVSAGSDQTVCSGGDVTLSGSGASTYTWNNGVSNGVVFNPTVTKTYTVTGTDANGCVNTDDVVVTVLSLPSISGATDVCIGASTTLSGSGTASSSSPWLSSHPSVATVTSSGVVTGVSGGTTTITYTDNNGCQVEETVTVNGLPSISAGSDVSTCAGSAVTLSGSGGTSYVWNNSVTNGVSFVPTSTTTYTVTGTDANGCENTDDVVVTVNALPTISGTTTVCVGSTTDLDGSGTPATSNPWTSSNTGIATINSSGLVTGVASGTTTITYTNSNNCSITTTVTVNGGTNVSAGADLSVCSGTSVTLSGTGASSYSWDNGVTNGTAFTPTTTATYTVTGTDGNGCVTTDDVVVTVNALPSVSAGNDEAICDGDQITLSGSGASTYSWSGGVTNGTAFTPGSTATYTVTGTDGNGCVNTDQVTITVNTLPTVSAGSDQTVCAGEQVTLSGSGANSYSWTNGVTDGQAFTPSSTTTYTVTGTDGNGCTATDDVTVTVKALPVITGTTTLAVGTTSDLDGTGTAASSNAWTSSNTAIATVNPSTGLVQGVSAGSVTITYTDSDGCSKTQTVTITPLPIISGTLSVCVGSTTDLDGTGTAASSSPWTSSNGAVATVNTNGLVTGVSAGTATITYTDNNGGTASQTVTVHALPTVSAGSDQTVCAGTSVTLSGSGASTYSWDNGVTNGVSFIPTTTTTYTVTGTDGNGCVNTDQVVVTVNPIPTISNMADVCVGTTLTLAGSGTASSTTPWASSDASVATITSSGVVTGVAAGTTTITYLDNNGCSKTETLTVLANPTVAVSADDSEVCSGTTVTLTATGGTTYTWADNSAGATRDVTPTSTTTYTVTGEDANGCSSDASVTVTVNALPAITGTFDVCVGETTDLDANGIPATSSPWTSSNTSVATVNSNGVVTGIAAGIVEITYTNTNGCSITQDVTVNGLPTVSAGADISTCLGTSVTLSGTGAVSYVWDNGVTNGTAFTPTSTATYTVTGTDANGCVATDDVVVTVNSLPTITGGASVCVDETVQLSSIDVAASSNPWVSSDVGVATVSSSGLVTGVGAGTATITFTNNNGCQATHSVTVNAVPTISGTLSTIIGGTTTLTGSGTAASTGAWVSSAQGVATVVSGVVTGVSAGTTTITYTTSSGCSVTETVTIYAMPTITSSGVSGPQEVCAGSTVDFDGSGTAASSSPWTSSNGAVATVNTNGLVTGVSAGTATITYTDNNGGTASQTVTVHALPTVSAGSDQTVCAGTSVTLSGSGASTYSWDNGVTNGVSFIPTTTTTYTVTGTDGNGCVNTDQVVVTVNPIPTISNMADVCVGTTLTLAGSGTASSTTPWASSDASVATITSSGVVTGVAAGTTTITYLDNNGCSKTETLTVLANPTVAVSADDSEVCSGTTVTLTATGGTTYTWADNSAGATRDVTPTSTTTYTVTGEDANGCSSDASVTVTVNALPAITGTFDVCVGETTDLDANGIPATSSPWTSSNTSVATVNSNGVVTGIAAGIVEITYTNTNGCSITQDVTVNGLPTVSAGADISTCLGTSVTLSGTGAVSYVWDNGVTNGTAFTPTSTATYTVTGTDANGCVATDDVVVTVNSLPTITGGASVCVDETVQLSSIDVAASSNPWVSSDVGVATVSSSGLVTGVGAGTATITFTNNNGCQATHSVTVNAVPTISGTLSTIIGGTTTLTGSGTAASTGAWVSSAQGVATVVSGVVTGVSAGTTTITYTTSSGCSVTETVTIYAMPTITSSGVSGPQEVCAGSTVDFDGSGTAASSSPWTSSNGAVATVNTNGLVTGVSAGTATITYTDNNGGTASQTVTVHALPTVSAGSDQTVCAGTSVTLSGSGASTYSWDNGVTNGVSFIPTTTTTYTVTGTDGNGCVNTDQVVVTVNPIPTISNMADVCVGTTLTLAGSGTASSTTPWASSDASVATITSSGVVTGVAAGTTTITYLDNNGCSKTETLTVLANPTVAVSADDSEVCSGTTVTLTATGGTTYTWADNSAGATRDVTPTSTTTYTVTGEDANGCSSDASVTVTVNALPAITGTFDVCVGETTDLDANGIPATSSPWTSSNTSVATVNSNGVVTGIAAGIVEITYTNTNGCSITEDVKCKRSSYG